MLKCGVYRTASLGSRLGEYDAGRVVDLGLPTIASAPGRAELAPVKPVKATAPPSEPPTTKFQLGERLPVVPARIVRRILKANFVDMAELTEENLELELRRSLEGEESKPVPAHKLRPVGDLLGWVSAFYHFAGIVIHSHPSKAVDLWAYLAIILSGGKGSRVTGGGHMMPDSDNKCLPRQGRVWMSRPGPLYKVPPVLRLQWDREDCSQPLLGQWSCPKGEEAASHCVILLERRMGMCLNTLPFPANLL